MNVRPITDVRAVTLRFSVPLVLGAIVTTATAVHAMLALRSPSPWIVPDELIYSELAKSLGEGDLPSIRDEISFGYGLGYPALLAPIWAVFDDATKAYALAKVLNALCTEFDRSTRVLPRSAVRGEDTRPRRRRALGLRPVDAVRRYAHDRGRALSSLCPGVARDGCSYRTSRVYDAGSGA